jgi:hypothetical protein
MPNTPIVDNKGYIDIESAVKLKEAESRTAVEMKHAESEAMFRELLIRESAKETAAKHLAKFAGFYLTFLVMAFILSIQFIPENTIAVVAGLITLVVTNLSTILKGIVENGDESEGIPKKPADNSKNKQETLLS